MRFASPLLIAVSLFLSGCASFGERSVAVRNNFARGDIAKANAEIEKQLKKKKRADADVLKLNRAIIELCSGKPKEAEQILREVRDNFDQNDLARERKVAEKTLSMLTDDNTVAYSGEDYEKVLIRVFLALANLMHDGIDAPAYALQIGRKQDEIVHKGTQPDPQHTGKTVNPKAESYRQIAIGQYLIGAMQEATYRNFDDAVKCYENVCRWEPNFSQGKQDLERAKHGVPTKPGYGAVYVFCLVGAGPYKKQENCEVLQAAQFYTTWILSMNSSRTMVPDLSPVMVPCIVRPQQAPTLDVSIDGKWSGTTETIMDIGKMAADQFEAVKPQIVARAVVRRTLKKGIVHGAKEASDANPWVSLAMEAGGMIWESMETADTRCWNLLPAEIQVVRLEVPAGEHTLCIPDMRKIPGRRFDLGETKQIRVEAGRNTYVLANFIGGDLVGKISVSKE